VEQFKKWFSKCDYASAVLEMENESRHLHAQIWSNTPKARGDICKAAQRICERSVKDWDNAQLKVLRSGVKIAYSDWYLDYLEENDLKEPPNIIYSNVPALTMEFYPTEEDQLNLQTMKTAVDPRFANLEIQCLAFLGDRTVTEKSVASYLADAMFVTRTIKVVIQQRDRIALAKSLYAYVSKSTDIYNFLPKEPEQVKYEKLLSQVNIQECPDVSQDPSSPELHPYASSTAETLDTDEEDSHW
jgi:hypothetical protein